MPSAPLASPVERIKMPRFIPAPDFPGSPLRRRKAAPADESVTLLPSAKWLDLAQAAGQLGLTVEDFTFHLLLCRIPAPINGAWAAETLILRNRAPDAEKLSGIYIVQFLEFIKIGFSTDLLQRVASLQDSLPLRIKIHRIIEGPTRRRESQLHRRFAEYRTRGEWFRHQGRLAAWIEAGCK